jgi:acetyl esterase/lipase
MRNRIAGTLIATLLSIGGVSQAQAPAAPALPTPVRIEPLRAPAAEIPLYPQGAPKLDGAAAAERWNSMAGDPIVRNVVEPTVTPFLPKPGTATGAAVLVAPGGGFNLLSIKNEGWDVARWLADHGVAAFVLKYRTRPTPEDEKAFDEFGRKMMSGAMRPAPGADPAGPAAPPPAFQPAVDDGIAAMKLIRSRAQAWNIDPARVGMIGFSAGAMNTLSVTLAQSSGAIPSFIGLIYGPMAAVTAPSNPPPLFAAVAADDFIGRGGSGILDSWRKAGSGAEFHQYQKGGHGFGMLANGTTTELWTVEFLAWLKMNGFLAARH